MNLPHLDIHRGPSSLSLDSEVPSPVWAPDSEPVTPADAITASFSHKDRVDAYFASRDATGEGAQPSFQRAIEEQGRDALCKGGRVHSLHVDSSFVESPVDDSHDQGQDPAPGTPFSGEQDAREPNQAPSLFIHPNVPFHHPAIPISPAPSLSERDDTLPIAPSPSLPTSPSLPSNETIDALKGPDSLTASDTQAIHPQSSNKCTDDPLTLPTSATAFLADLASTLGAPSTGPHASGTAPPPNSVTPSAHGSPTVRSAHDTTADVKSRVEDGLDTWMGMRQSDDVRLVQNIPCPSPTPLAAGETADISSTEAVLGEEDADEVDAFSFAARRDVDASSMVAVLGHEDEDEEEPTNAMESDFVDALTGSNTSLASFPGFDVAMFALGQGRSATLAVPPKDDGDTRSIEAVLGAEDALAMEATADVVEEALQVPQEENEETDASSDVDTADSIVFTFDSALAHALSLAPTPAHGQDPDLALILADADIAEDAPWKALCTRTWTREDAARALLFIPWCALVGAAICLHPRTVGRLVFQPSSSSSSSPTFLSLPLPRSPAPPTPVRRLAHHAHTALGHVACFVFVLGALAWVFPVVGMGVGLGVGGITAKVWGGFKVEKAVRKGMRAVREEEGEGEERVEEGWMDVACVGAVLGGLEEEFVRALVVEGR